jgi:ABC-type antimicrobial peptide transport system permease subunit
VALVNKTFAKRYFGGANPIGRSFEQRLKDKTTTTEIVGYVRDARYADMREPIQPTVYVPVASVSGAAAGFLAKDWATFVVRTDAENPSALAPMLRQEVSRARSELRVSNIVTQRELVEQHTVRERLLATVSLFFAGLALVLAGIGLYGVLYFSVVQRRREFGIRMALGARAGHVARGVTAEVAAMLALGAAAGLAVGIASERFVRTLLYEVRATDTAIVAAPALIIVVVGVLAAAAPVFRAVRIDPAETLRAE